MFPSSRPSRCRPRIPHLLLALLRRNPAHRATWKKNFSILRSCAMRVAALLRAAHEISALGFLAGSFILCGSRFDLLSWHTPPLPPGLITSFLHLCDQARTLSPDEPLVKVTPFGLGLSPIWYRISGPRRRWRYPRISPRWILPPFGPAYGYPYAVLVRRASRAILRWFYSQFVLMLGRALLAKQMRSSSSRCTLVGERWLSLYPRPPSYALSARWRSLGDRWFI